MILTKNKKRLKTQRRKPFFLQYRKKITVFIKYRKKIQKSSCINFYKEVFIMEDEEVVLSEEMTEELSNGREENEDE